MARPFIFINMASSADGKITTAAREYPKMTTPLDRETMDRLRAGADAVLIGAGTLRADHPALHVRTDSIAEERRRSGRAGLLKVVVSASGDIPPDSRSLKDPDQGGIVLATTDAADHPSLEQIGQRARIWRLGAESVDLRRLVERLSTEGVERLLVEGGGELNWQFFQLDLVDELYLTLAPSVIGGRTAPTAVEGEGFAMADQRRLELVQADRHGDELYLRYRVRR